MSPDEQLRITLAEADIIVNQPSVGRHLLPMMRSRNPYTPQEYIDAVGLFKTMTRDILAVQKPVRTSRPIRKSAS